jgi:hypothetical protein
MKPSKCLEAIAANHGIVILEGKLADRESVSAVGLEGLRATISAFILKIPTRTQCLNLHRPTLLYFCLESTHHFHPPGCFLLSLFLPTAVIMPPV